MTPNLSPREEAEAIDQLYEYADALKATEKLLSRIRLGRFADLDALLDQPTYVGDLSLLAAKINGIADAAQDKLCEAEEAEDRRRANPLEPDFREAAR